MKKEVDVRYVPGRSVHALNGFKIPKPPSGPPGFGYYHVLRLFVRREDYSRSYSVARNEDGEVVGFAYTSKGLHTIPSKMKIPYVDEVFVHPFYRKQGIGTMLVKKLLSRHAALAMKPVTGEGKALADRLMRQHTGSRHRRTYIVTR